MKTVAKQKEERLIKIIYEKSRRCALSEIEVDSYRVTSCG